MPEEAKNDDLRSDVEIHELPEETQIIAPMEAEATFEYTKEDIG